MRFPPSAEAFPLLSLACFFCLLCSGCGLLWEPEVDVGAPLPAVSETSAAAVAPEARQAYEQALALWREGGSSVLAAERCSDPVEALELLDAAIAREPSFAAAYIRRGLAKSELGQGEEAFEDLTHAIRLEPGAESYAYRGLVSIRAKQARAARRDLEYSLSLNPDQSRAYNYLGVLELSNNNAAQACVRFDQGCAHGDCSFKEAARQEKICP